MYPEDADEIFHSSSYLSFEIISFIFLFKNLIDIIYYTIHPKIIIEDLKEREGIPCIGELFPEDGIHIDGEERPEYLGMFDQEIAEPGESLEKENIYVSFFLKKHDVSIR